MIALMREHQQEIARHCQAHGVFRLSVFGSAAKGTWREDESDIDVLIDLEYGPGDGKRFMRFVSSLERLHRTRVDIVTERFVTSEWFREELRKTAASGTTAPAGNPRLPCCASVRWNLAPDLHLPSIEDAVCLVT